MIVDNDPHPHATIRVDSDREVVVTTQQNTRNTNRYRLITVVDVDGGVTPITSLSDKAKDVLADRGYTLVSDDDIQGRMETPTGEVVAYTATDGRMSINLRKQGQTPHWHSDRVNNEPWVFEGSHRVVGRPGEDELVKIETNRGPISINPKHMDIPNLDVGDVYHIVGHDVPDGDPQSGSLEIVEWSE